MKYFISLISALLFTFTVFAQGVLEIKQSRQTLKNLLADDQPMTVVYTAQNTGTQPVSYTHLDVYKRQYIQFSPEWGLSPNTAIRGFRMVKSFFRQASSNFSL